MADELIATIRQAVTSGVDVRVSINTTDVRNVLLTAALTVVVSALLIKIILKKK